MKRFLMLAALLSTAAAAQKPPAPSPAPSAPAAPLDPAARIAAQKEAMKALAFLDGAWRGGAEAGNAAFIQTERVGTMLDGTVRAIEGHGRDGSGKTVFNAFGIISFDPAKRSYSIRSYAMGFAGDYPMTVRPDGFSWSHPAGPGAEIRYTATVKDGEWHEVGARVAGSAAPVKMFEMRLRRPGPTGWPQDGAVPIR